MSTLDLDDSDLSLTAGDPVPNDADGGRERQRPTPPHVLLIDDEPAIRAALRRFFKRLGWEATEAVDGTEALSLLLGKSKAASRDDPHARYDMVLSDVRMPGLNGIQLFERLKAERPEILPRLVFTTGDVAGSETAELVREFGCEVIHKPFDLALVQAIAERLTRS